MSRYIDADALLDKTVHMAKECFGVGQCYCLRTQFQKMIEDALTIDVVQVVRCRECVHGLNSKRCGGAIFDDNVIWCTHIGEYFTKDHYCADGKRKEQADADS